MSTIQINSKNIASTSRPDEFLGTIALDHHTYGRLLESLLNKNIDKYLNGGYSFIGAQVHLGDSVRVTQEDFVYIKFILSDSSEKLFYVKRKIKFSEFLLSFTDIVFQFTDRLNFERYDLDWESIVEIDEEENED